MHLEKPTNYFPYARVCRDLHAYTSNTPRLASASIALLQLTKGKHDRPYLLAQHFQLQKCRKSIIAQTMVLNAPSNPSSRPSSPPKALAMTIIPLYQQGAACLRPCHWKYTASSFNTYAGTHAHSLLYTLAYLLCSAIGYRCVLSTPQLHRPLPALGL